MNDFERLMNQVFLGEHVYNYLTFAGIVIATLLLKKPMAALLTRLSSRLGTRYNYATYKVTIGELVFKPMERLLQAVLYFIAINQLTNLLESMKINMYLFGGRKEKASLSLGEVVDHIFLFMFIAFLGQVLVRFIDFFYFLSFGKAEADKNRSRQQMLPLIREIAKLSVWSACIFWTLGAVFHVNIPALITGLGIGGVAIALAGKETVENFFAAFTLLSDKPFVVGEIIKIGDYEGVVERIGFRSTRLRNIDGATIVIPNQTLVSQNLVNLTSGNSRGMKSVVNIRYGLSHETLDVIIKELEERIAAIAPVKRPVSVVLENLDKETLQITVSYRLPHPISEDYQLPAIKNNINMHVFEIVNKHAHLGQPLSGEVLPDRPMQ